MPIGAFGGAASDILDMLHSVRDASSVPTWEYRKMLSQAQWTKRSRDVSLYALGIQVDPDTRRSVFINYRQSDTMIEFFETIFVH